MEPLPVPPTHLLEGASLFLDFDGTLVEIAERPDAIEVDDRLVGLLRLLAKKLEGRVALISGRPAAEVRALLEVGPMVFVGSHGLEFDWADGRVGSVERPPALSKAIEAMRALEASTSGLFVEDKPLGAALHFRRAPAAEEASVELAVRLATELGLQLQHGKMMVELRAPGGDKGSAIRVLMEDPLFAATHPVFMGDDLTDEPGFLAARSMGGAGVLIGPRRSTAAGYNLAGVSETLAWLREACDVVL